MKILIVDDAALMRNVLKHILTHEGYEVAEAANGEEALRRYAEEQPDLVTMDLVMPDMDGIETVRELKQRDPAVRVIMCSGLDQQAMVMDAIRAGASDCIVEPYRPRRVLEAVHKALDDE